jgi:acetyltransferase-like isoleucine patch superfamily enzyme
MNPEKHARKIGVKVGKNPHFYGPVSWGSEPWIITIGDNVHITGGCKFIAHDGGTLIFRDQIPDLEITKPITVGNNVFIGPNCGIYTACHPTNSAERNSGLEFAKPITIGNNVSYLSLYQYQRVTYQVENTYVEVTVNAGYATLYFYDEYGNTATYRL